MQEAQVGGGNRRIDEKNTCFFGSIDRGVAAFHLDCDWFCWGREENEVLGACPRYRVVHRRRVRPREKRKKEEGKKKKNRKKEDPSGDGGNGRRWAGMSGKGGKKKKKQNPPLKKKRKKKEQTAKRKKGRPWIWIEEKKKASGCGRFLKREGS